MLELQGIEVRREAFSLHANITLPPGGVVAVIGESGAGKSTLFDVIAGFAEPTTGQVVWDGQSITQMSPAARPISILFQDNNLFPHLNVGRNVALGLTTVARPGPDVAQQVDFALERVGLRGVGDRRPGDLSGGQRSRVALARALVRARPLVLLDEPFAALGPALKAEMLDLTAEAMQAAGATVLMITHDPQDARRVAERTVVVTDGMVEAPQSTRALLDNPPPALASYFSKE